MTVKGYIRLKRHRQFVLERVLDLKNKIFHDAVSGREVSEIDRELFLKYNNRLKRIRNYSF